MSYRTAEETALLMYRLLLNSGLKRARVSDTTVRKLSRRSLLRTTFLGEIKSYLEDMGVLMIELHRGGFGLMFASLLEGATAISAKKFMAEEMAKLKNGKQREDLFNDIRAQLDEPVDEGDDS